MLRHCRDFVSTSHLQNCISIHARTRRTPSRPFLALSSHLSHLAHFIVMHLIAIDSSPSLFPPTHHWERRVHTADGLLAAFSPHAFSTVSCHRTPQPRHPTVLHMQLAIFPLIIIVTPALSQSPRPLLPRCNCGRADSHCFYRPGYFIHFIDPQPLSLCESAQPSWSLNLLPLLRPGSCSCTLISHHSLHVT